MGGKEGEREGGNGREREEGEPRRGRRGVEKEGQGRGGGQLVGGKGEQIHAKWEGKREWLKKEMVSWNRGEGEGTRAAMEKEK